MVFRLFPPPGCFSSAEVSQPQRLGVSEREGIESGQILERTGSVWRGGSIKGRTRVPHRGTHHITTWPAISNIKRKREKKIWETYIVDSTAMDKF